MKILIAPNAFKNSLSAEDAAMAIKQGLETSRLDCTCVCFPIGDGGDGTAALIVKQCEGDVVHVMVHDPIGRKIKASYGLIDNGKTAVIEMANASGLRLLHPDELNPLAATSFGTGEQIMHALEMGVRKIIITMGGTATVDGGIGILRAMGVRFSDDRGAEIKTPEALSKLSEINLRSLDAGLLKSEFVILCDVTNPLLGSQGAANVFGPQKGADKNGVIKLEASLSKFVDVTQQQTGKDLSRLPFGGTAGGAAAGLSAFLGAHLVNGIEYFLQLTDFEKALAGTDLLITGEGSIDEQTLQGKGPFGVASAAKIKSIPVIAVAGKVPVKISSTLQNYFDVLIAIGSCPQDLQTAIKHTAEDLRRTATQLGNLLSSGRERIT
jgi:glycerate kinase